MWPKTSWEPTPESQDRNGDDDDKYELSDAEKAEIDGLAEEERAMFRDLDDAVDDDDEKDDLE